MQETRAEGIVMTLTKKQENPFVQYPAVKKLEELASQPINLSEPQQLTPKRIAGFFAEACGYRLLFGTERVTDEVIKTLDRLAVEGRAIEKMHKMQDGEVVNFVNGFPSEDRPALHTATRDVFDHPRTTPKAQEASKLARQELDKLRSWCAKLETEKKFDEMIVIGIGGSELGPRANYTALKYLRKPGRQVHFISNVDPDDAAGVLKKANLKKTIIVVISKSGTTLETATNEEFVKERLKKEGLNPKEHLISITMPKTPMDNREIYEEVFYLWDWVGGRLSTTSMVGGVILAFAYGFDVFWEFLKGAHEMDLNALETDPKKNLPLLAALLGIWNHNFLKYPTLAIIPYCQALRHFPAHLQQLDMESNGKSLGQDGVFVEFKTGPIIWGSQGTNAQHSYFQLLHQGTAPTPLFMIGFKKSQYGEDIEMKGTTSQEKLLANLFAQSLALATGTQPDNLNKFCPGNRPTSILLGERLTPHALGALLAFYEHKVAFQGFIWGINSFDQEGVQLGKIVANRIIDRFAQTGEKKGQEDPLVEAYLKHLGNE